MIKNIEILVGYTIVINTGGLKYVGYTFKQ